MDAKRDGNAIVWCDGGFNTLYGKTAHGLVRRSRRYDIVAVVDRAHAGRDAGDVLDDREAGIPVVADIESALRSANAAGTPATHLVFGLAPDGGVLSAAGRAAVCEAIGAGLHIVAGLHDFLSEDAEIAALAARHAVTVHDVRKPPPRGELHFFANEIAEVEALRVAVLGTDSAVGKRTTAWLLVEGFEAAGRSAELIGTGQTAWLQGAEFSIVLDSLVNDFVAGELEHAVLRAWRARRPDVMVIEGQGSLMNPAYPGGFEILAATRPDLVVLQHAPARQEYDGFPGFPIQPLRTQVEAIELIGGKPVVAITLNHEAMASDEIAAACDRIRQETGLPTFDVLANGPAELVEQIAERPR